MPTDALAAYILAARDANSVELILLPQLGPTRVQVTAFDGTLVTARLVDAIDRVIRFHYTHFISLASS